VHILTADSVSRRMQNAVICSSRPSLVLALSFSARTGKPALEVAPTTLAQRTLLTSRDFCRLVDRFMFEAGNCVL